MSRAARGFTACALLAAGCASSTSYEPRLLARGELALRYGSGRFSMKAEGREIAHGLRWAGLPGYVHCVPEAHRHAVSARRNGDLALAFSVIGGVLGASALVGLVGLADERHRWTWLGGGLGAAAAGLVFSIVGHDRRSHADGNAVDAMNLYNDAIGSRGASCADPRLPVPPAPPTAPPADSAAATPVAPPALPSSPVPTP